MAIKNKNIIIGICGGSCSGKTTFAQELWQYFGPEKSILIYQDDYYIDQSHRFDRDGGNVNFDHPDALELSLLGNHLNILKQNKNIDCPIYDFVTHKRKNDLKKVAAKKFIILDGTLILHHPDVCQELDYSVFIFASEELRFQRRLKRDTTERGRTGDGVHAQFYSQVKPMHDLFVETSADNANISLNSNWSEQEFMNIVNSIRNLDR